ncbi:L-idonate 5-dehydrogenase [Donghicola eburneus]|uniref:Phosphoesterase n=1 Tax=Donghicola eburneus TaxID=393278 RepID=A0A1M4MYE0_9RHOB|nr:L-idonate 5-dehydrogenase [Donghicola eburneus]SCM67592.1 phosphoesterase [Donghicola eburneus]SFQ07910.1 L-idonate 5-dehydrogenase [Donghicola eburneus]
MKALFAHGAEDLRLSDCVADPLGPTDVRIRMERGGICGSDLHYFNHGGFGTVRLKEPMVLGHEVAGRVAELGANVTNLKVGDLVAVSPSRPCGDCVECHRGLPNECLNMRFYGSAMPFPHIQGAFREEITVMASQCHVANDLTPAEAAMAEPLSVALHAVRRAGNLMGAKVLVTGCGPIGLLAILAARRAGAAQIIAVDITDTSLAMAAKVGADVTLNTMTNPDALADYATGKGTLDVLFECSGAAPALAGAIPALRPRGVIVQLGLSGDMPLPMMQITAKELELRGSFRFHEEFAVAVQLMSAGLIDVKPLLTHTFPLTEFQTAFETANDRTQAIKVQLSFGA